MFKIETETDLHHKVVKYIFRFYPDVTLIGGLGENQDTSSTRIDSHKKRYLKGQPDLMNMNKHIEHTGLCIEFKTLNNNYKVSEAQLAMIKQYKSNGYKVIITNDYDSIAHVNHYIEGVRIPCEYCKGREPYLSHKKHFK